MGQSDTLHSKKASQERRLRTESAVGEAWFRSLLLAWGIVLLRQTAVDAGFIEWTSAGREGWQAGWDGSGAGVAAEVAGWLPVEEPHSRGVPFKAELTSSTGVAESVPTSNSSSVASSATLAFGHSLPVRRCLGMCIVEQHPEWAQPAPREMLDPPKALRSHA